MPRGVARGDVFILKGFSQLVLSFNVISVPWSLLLWWKVLRIIFFVKTLKHFNFSCCLNTVLQIV